MRAFYPHIYACSSYGSYFMSVRLLTDAIDTGHKAGRMPGVTPRLTGHARRDAGARGGARVVPQCMRAMGRLERVSLDHD
jgi:hypothetical protein